MQRAGKVTHFPLGIALLGVLFRRHRALLFPVNITEEAFG
jgi:hypothetical protein